MTHPLKISLVYGSVREGRLCDTVARWAISEITARRDLVLDIIDPAALALDCEDDLAKLRAQIDAADGFIVVTPEYNHGYPGALKALIDAVGEQWDAKPVSFISYGGMSGGLRAVEQLRLVFAELGMVTVRDQLSFANVWEQFGSGGELFEPERARRTLTTMLKRLVWWGSVLRDARATLPYAEAA